MSRRKQARPRAVKRELENALTGGSEEEEVVKEAEGDCANNNNNNGPANPEGSGEEAEERVSNSMSGKGTEVCDKSPNQPSEEGSPGCPEEDTRQIYRCDACGVTLATLSDFMDHRNYVCGSADKSANTHQPPSPIKCSTLEARSSRNIPEMRPAEARQGSLHSHALMSMCFWHVLAPRHVGGQAESQGRMGKQGVKTQRSQRGSLLMGLRSNICKDTHFTVLLQNVLSSGPSLLACYLSIWSIFTLSSRLLKPGRGYFI